MNKYSDCLPNAASHCHSLLILVIAWFLLFPEIAQAEGPVPQEAPPAELPREALLAGWESTYGNINSMDVEFSHKLVEKIILDDSKFKSLDLSIFGENYALRLLQDGVRVRALSSTSPKGFDEPSSIRGYSFDGSTTMEYNPDPRRKGVITPGLEEQGVYNALSDYLRCRKHHQSIKEIHPSWVDKFAMLCDLRDYDHEGAVFPDVKVRPIQEQVAGEWCHVIEVASTDLSVRPGIRIWMATGKGMLVMRYEKTMPNSSETSETMEVQEVANIETEIGDAWYPKRASSRKNYGSFVLIYQLDVHKFVPYVKPSADEFRLIFPEGTGVYDKVLEIVYKVSKTGNTTIYNMAPGHKGELIGEASGVDIQNLQNLDYLSNADKTHLIQNASPVASAPSSSPSHEEPVRTAPSPTHLPRPVFYGIAAVALCVCCLLLLRWRDKTKRSQQ